MLPHEHYLRQVADPDFLCVDRGGNVPELQRVAQSGRWAGVAAVLAPIHHFVFSDPHRSGPKDPRASFPGGRDDRGNPDGPRAVFPER